MRIENEIKSRCIELSKTAAEQTHYPSLELNITFETEDLKLSSGFQTWIAVQDLENFIEQLKVLDQNRQGKADLQSMSPGEFVLRFEAVNAQGHLSAGLKLNKIKAPAGDYSSEISIQFLIDPGSLQRLIPEFEKLIES